VKTDILLTGLVSGLTILLGVITADWLKRLRDRINYARRITSDISHSRSEDENELIETINLMLRELRDLSEIPRWPQRNARGIRQAASNFRICLFANAEHCQIYQLFLHEENAEELRRLELALRIATRSRRALETMTLHLSEKAEELKQQMLSREAANS
jgi:hypothetical protein